MAQIDWNDEKVKGELNAVKLYLTGMDGEDGGIINITQNVLPDFGDDYEIIADDWNKFCPPPSEKCKGTVFNCALVNGMGWAVSMLDHEAREFYEKVMDFAERAREKVKKHKDYIKDNIGFKWVGESNDGCYHGESEKQFTTLRECYEDMRNAALEKAKWNTQFDEDFEDGVVIGYEFKFHPLKITHESYSGIYTYRVVKADGTEVDKNLFPCVDAEK